MRELARHRLEPRTGVERVVVAVDGGAGSRAALRWVIDHLGGRAAQVAVVSVVEEGDPELSGEADVRAAMIVLETINDGTQVDGQLRRGDPVDELAAAAAELDSDLLVIGTHAGPG
ncbi:MAG: universal stress protein, partial [Rhodoglobus sp.]